MQINAQQGRDRGLDVLRGIAIATMIWANFAPFLLLPEHPMWLRAISSIAAPLFVSIAGYLVQISEKHDFQYYLKRGAAVIFFGMILDMGLAGAYPFTGISVLYLIGIAIPFCALLSKLKTWQIGVSVGICMALGPIMQKIFGYSVDPFYVYFGESPSILFSMEGIKTIGRQWLFEGTFPLFPWLGFAGLGILIRRFERAQVNLTWLGSILFILGIAIYFIFPPQLFTKMGFSELFYPATDFFILTYSGLVILFFQFRDHFTGKLSQPLIELGNLSLLIYLSHLAFAYSVLHRFIEPGGILLYLGIVFGYLLLNWKLAEWLNKEKGGREGKGLLHRMILGI